MSIGKGIAIAGMWGASAYVLTHTKMDGDGYGGFLGLLIVMLLFVLTAAALSMKETK